MKFRMIIDKNASEEITAVVHAPNSLTKQIEDLVNSYSGADHIMAYSEDEMRRLAFGEIECITVIQRRVTVIDAKGERYTVRERLRDLEEILPSYFIRINKSAIANENLIQRFDATFSGGVDAVFFSGYREYVSRRCFAEIKRRYDK